MALRPISFLFDLDGTLVDSVYQHVLAWHDALEAEGIELSVWRIHRKIGMSGGLFTNMLLRETGLAIEPERDRTPAAAARRGLHAACAARSARCPGARELLALLTDGGIPWAIATSGRMETAGPCWRPRRRSRRASGRHPRQGPLRQARPRPVPGRRRGARRSRSRAPASSATAIWDMLAARRAGALASASCRAAMARTNCAGRRLPRLRGPGRPAGAPRRGRRPALSRPPAPAIVEADADAVVSRWLAGTSCRSQLSHIRTVPGSGCQIDEGAGVARARRPAAAAPPSSAAGADPRASARSRPAASPHRPCRRSRCAGGCGPSGPRRASGC